MGKSRKPIKLDSKVKITFGTLSGDTGRVLEIDRSKATVLFLVGMFSVPFRSPMWYRRAELVTI